MLRTILARTSVPVLALALHSAGLSAQNNGETWQLLSPANNPGERADYMMAFHTQSTRTLLFGGDELGTTIPIGETWIWNGIDWTQISPAVEPSPRSRAAMAYDPMREVIVMYGGADNGSPLGDTWEFDGAEWAQVQPVNSPPALLGAAMAWDPINEKMLLFGGATAFTEELQGDTYHYDGLDWELLTPVSAPLHRKDHRMVTDTLRDRIVLFGGTDQEVMFQPALTTRSDQTWEWNGTNWIFQNRATVPDKRERFGMAFDEVQGITVLCYGQNGSRSHGDTLAWDGVEWRDIFVTPKPGARSAIQLVANSNSGRLLTYGGDVAQAEPGETIESWEFFGQCNGSSLPYGLGCAGTVGMPPTLRNLNGSRPVVGNGFNMVLDNLPTANGSFAVGMWGFSNEIWGDTRFFLPDDLGWLGMPGCDLLVSLDRVVPLVITPGGQANWTLNVPLNNDLCGLSFYAQGLIVDPGANALGVIVSDAIAGAVGLR